MDRAEFPGKHPRRRMPARQRAVTTTRFGDNKMEQEHG